MSIQPKQSGRRRFLRHGAALAGLAVGLTRAAKGATLAGETPEVPAKDLHAYGERSRFEMSLRTGSIGTWPTQTSGPDYRRDFGFRTPLQDSVGMITPPALHYIVSHGFEPPDIDPREHRLLIHGMVDRPLIFSLEDLRRLPSVTRVHFLECNGNSAPSGPTGPPRIATGATAQDTHGLTSCSVWTGIPMSLLLNQAGVQKGATWIVAEGSERGKHHKSIPIEKAMEDVLVAYGQNGEALRPEQGYPLRLLVPGWEGLNNVKYLKHIKVVDHFLDPSGVNHATIARADLGGKYRWYHFQWGPKSVITLPSGGIAMPGKGYVQITGLAWSGGGAVRKVDVSTDGGKTWKEAKLQAPVLPKAHTRFTFDWAWDGDAAVL